MKILRKKTNKEKALQSTGLKSKKTKPFEKSSVLAGGSIVESTPKVPPAQEDLERDQCGNETNFPPPVVLNITMFFSGDLNQDSAMPSPQKVHPQVKKKRQKRRKKQTYLQPTKFDFIPNTMPSETESLPVYVDV